VINISNFYFLKTLFAISIFILVIFAGWLPFKYKLRQQDHLDFPLGETLATGVFLGAALIHMLPEANTLFQQLNYRYPLAYLITGIVFLLFLWLEHIGKELYHHNAKSNAMFAILAWIMLSIHSLVLGTALGFTQDYSLMLMLFFAIITHKWAESFAISLTLNKCNLRARISLILFIIFASMTPIGIYLGWRLGHTIATHSLWDPILIAISAGTFLYLGTLHGLERCVMVQRCCNLRYFSFVIIGFVLMSAVALYL